MNKDILNNIDSKTSDINKYFSSDYKDVEKSDDLKKIVVSNFIKRTKEQLITDLSNAGVSVEQYNAMVKKEYPLGFEDKNQFEELCKDLIKAIMESKFFTTKDKSTGNNNKSDEGDKIFTKENIELIFTGTSTTFYSENPDKEEHFFDKDVKYKSDIDIAIRFKGELLKEFNNYIKGKEKSQPKNESLKKQQVSQVDTSKIFKLDKFHSKWGPHEYDTSTVKDNTKLKRNVGVITFKLNDTKMLNKCDYRIYYPPRYNINVEQIVNFPPPPPEFKGGSANMTKKNKKKRYSNTKQGKRNGSMRLVKGATKKASKKYTKTMKKPKRK